MGFLSRKKPQAAVEIEEQHPIGDELQQMEEAVPEKPRDAGPQPAGPVSDEASPEPGSGDTSSSPPAEEAETADEVATEAEIEAEVPAEQAEEVAEEAEQA